MLRYPPLHAYRAHLLVLLAQSSNEKSSINEPKFNLVSGLSSSRPLKFPTSVTLGAGFPAQFRLDTATQERNEILFSAPSKTQL
jgi:hypothetical protein